MKAVPKNRRLHAHHWLILHGRYTCKAQRPLCPSCIVSDLCAYKGKTVGQPTKRGAKRTAGQTEGGA